MENIIPYSWIGKLNVIKIPLLLKFIYRFKAIPVKALIGFFFRENQQAAPKIHMEESRAKKSQGFLKNEEMEKKN